MTFAVPPLHLPATRRFATEPQPAAPTRPAAEAVVPVADLEKTTRPVSAAFRDLTIPDVVPIERHSWRRQRRVRRRES
jgi:hypothetical protein